MKSDRSQRCFYGHWWAIWFQIGPWKPLNRSYKAECILAARSFRIAPASAFFCSTNTTNCLPRINPVAEDFR